MRIDELKEKKVLILGFGREGRDTFTFLRRLFPQKTLGIADRVKIKTRDKRVKLHLGKNYLKALRSYDVIIKSPGIPFKILPKSVLPRIITQTDIFFENCPGKIVGVTGTKGKSTTSSLIYQILRSGGVKAHLIGNIEKPVLSYLNKAQPEDVYVYELSSHQLANLRKSPQIAVLLNVYREHLDYYRNFREYVNAKANITRYQAKNDYLIYNAGDKIVSKIAKKSKAGKIAVRGNYYSLDKAAARAAGKLFKIPGKVINLVIGKFKPLPHRLEFIGRFRGISFYNDSLATIPQATIGALDVLGSRVATIMLGGYERNIDYKNLAKRILKSRIKTLILFPTTGRKIWRQVLNLKRQGTSLRHFFVNDMEKAVRIAYDNTNRGKICLLSTASASFSIFKDYKEKGNLFKKYVKKFGHEKKI
jgi:UDP-N-acetylmuramoylalanine-D-glutamate ligase